jgi:hypothetical protein
LKGSEKTPKMKFPCSAEDIAWEIRHLARESKGFHSQRGRQYFRLLKQVESEMLHGAAMTLFSVEDSSEDLQFMQQDYLGKAMLALGVRSTSDPADFLSSLLPVWDVSVEELPFWSVENWGKEKVMHAMDDIGADADENVVAKIAVFRWWLKNVE